MDSRPPECKLVGDGPVVMVDDNEPDADIVRIYHGRSKVTQAFRHFTGGPQFFEYLDAPDSPMPSIVLLDINMPAMDGFEVLDALRARTDTRELPVVVMLTSSKAGADRARAEEKGANGYFVKPLLGREYLEFFNSLL